jgi:AraC-like DNA-binding protein
MKPLPSDKVYPVVKIALVAESLKEEGVSSAAALDGVHISPAEVNSAETRVSANQILATYRNALKLSRDPQFAHRTGLRFHVSSYGMYGFAILSSPSFRQTMAFATNYHQLAAPLADVSFREVDKDAVWTIVPEPYPQIDDLLYKFIVDLQMAVHLSLHRDIMGPSFRPSQIHFSFGRPRTGAEDAATFGCPVFYGRPENNFVFDTPWLDGQPTFGNAVTYSQVRQLCEKLLEEMNLLVGVAGKVREIYLANLGRHPSFEFVANRLNMSLRSLRRRLQEEGTSFRELVDDLRVQLAIKYVRDTDLTIEDIAFTMGFSDASAFRHAFRRWTGAAPYQFRRGRIDIETAPAGEYPSHQPMRI